MKGDGFVKLLWSNYRYRIVHRKTNYYSKPEYVLEFQDGKDSLGVDRWNPLCTILDDPHARSERDEKENLFLDFIKEFEKGKAHGKEEFSAV